MPSTNDCRAQTLRSSIFHAWLWEFQAPVYSSLLKIRTGCRHLYRTPGLGHTLGAQKSMFEARRLFSGIDRNCNSLKYSLCSGFRSLCVYPRCGKRCSSQRAVGHPSLLAASKKKIVPVFNCKDSTGDGYTIIFTVKLAVGLLWKSFKSQ